MLSPQFVPEHINEDPRLFDLFGRTLKSRL